MIRFDFDPGGWFFQAEIFTAVTARGKATARRQIVQPGRRAGDRIQLLFGIGDVWKAVTVSGYMGAQDFEDTSPEANSAATPP